MCTAYNKLLIINAGIAINENYTDSHAEETCKTWLKQAKKRYDTLNKRKERNHNALRDERVDNGENENDETC